MRATVTKIDAVREFWDRQPCNVRHSPKEPGSLQWSQEVTARRYRVEPHIPRFARFKDWKNRIVLELGCGIGTDALEFARHGAFIDAVDISVRSVGLAQQRANFLERPWLMSCYYANIESGLSFLPDDYYDLVYCFGVLHHTPNPARVIENALRVLRPGGEFRLMLYARWSIKNLLRQQPEAQADCPIARTYTARGARELLKGFEVLSIKKTHIFIYRIQDYIQQRYVVSAWYKWMPHFIFKFLQRCLGWHLLIVARKPS